MTIDDRDPESAPLAPDDAFALLGNETRMEMLRTLGDADEPMSFTDFFTGSESATPASSTITSTNPPGTLSAAPMTATNSSGQATVSLRRFCRVRLR